MRLRRLLAPIVAPALLAASALVGAASPALAAATAHAPVLDSPALNSPALNSPILSDRCSDAYFHDDARLGPAQLPTVGPVGRELVGYHRTGPYTATAFLAKFSTASGWIYPPADGFVQRPDGSPIEHAQELRPGQQVDRFGSEYGAFLAPAATPYAERSIPPQSLDNSAVVCNYHDYRVLRPFAVEAGPIAPWFGQPGRGTQYELEAGLVPASDGSINVGWLVANGYLERLV